MFRKFAVGKHLFWESFKQIKYRTMKKLIYLLIAVLGFSCAEEEEMLVMYGPMRPETYRVDARVIDQEGAPINGIEVSLGNTSGEFTPVSHTDKNGLYTLTLKEWPTVEVLRFTDIDGEANGGEFMDKSVNVKKVFQENDSVDGVISIDVTLKKRE